MQNIEEMRKYQSVTAVLLNLKKYNRNKSINIDGVQGNPIVKRDYRIISREDLIY